MQPSIFNVRVPLADAGRGVPDEHLHGRAAHRVARGVRPPRSPRPRRLREHGRTPKSAKPFTPSPRTASSSRAARPIAATSRTSSTTTAPAQDQLRVTVLTTLQCNFACDYCIQGDHGEYNKTAAKMSMETAARVAEWIEAADGRRPPEELRADVLRRRAAPQPAGRVLPGRARRGDVPCARHQLVFNIITNGLLLTPEVVDRLTRARPARRQGHARRRPRHAQPHAAAARRPGHVRQDSQERPAGRRSLPRLDRRQLRRIIGRQLPGAARLPARTGLRRQAGEGRVQADHPRVEAAQGPHPADGSRLGRQAARTARA